MEFLRDKSGADWFMEINMRNDGNGICVAGAGVNLPYIWWLACAGEDYKAEAARPVRDIFVMPEFDDLMLVLKGRLSLAKWIRDYRRTSTFMEYSAADAEPYYVRRRQFARHLIGKIFR